MPQPVLCKVFLAVLLMSVADAAPVFAKREKAMERMTPVPADQPIPLVDFFRPPLFTKPSLNPSGTTMAALATGDDERTVALLHDLTNGQYNNLHGDKEQDVYGLRWLTDERLLVSVGTDEGYIVGMFMADVPDVKRPRTRPFLMYSMAQVIAVPRAERTRPLVWLSANVYNFAEDSGVMQLDTDRPTPQLSVRNGPDARAATRTVVIKKYPAPQEGLRIAYWCNLEDKLAFCETVKDGAVRLHRFTGERWELTNVDLESVELLGSGDSAGELIVAERSNGQQPGAVRRLDAVTGQMGEELFRDTNYDFAESRIYRHPATNEIVGLGIARARWESLWFDARYRSVQQSVEKQFPRECVSILDVSDSLNRFLISAWSDRKPTAYYMADMEKGTFELVTSSRPWIDPARMQPMKIIRYKTRDGHEIEAYLTLPAGASKESPVPLVVLPHGGPFVRDTWGWDSEAQFLASRGYAVLQPNYRGSTSYQWRFPETDMWQFRKMHDDVTDGVAAVKRMPVIDPNRIAIMGGSFGGYLAMCGAAFEPDLYRCAITMAGVFDWERIVREERLMRNGRHSRLLRKLGDPSKNKNFYEEISPLKHLDNVHIPIYVAHGYNDRIVDVEQSMKLVSALKRRGIKYVAQFEKKEGHSMYKLENRLEMYGAIEAFLSEHLAK